MAVAVSGDIEMRAPGDTGALGRRLRGDVDHPSLAVFVEVGESVIAGRRL